MRYIYGLIAIVLGVMFVIKSEWLVNNFGANAWAEEHLGTSGGSRLMYKLMGIAIIILTVMILSGMAQEIFLSVLGRTFGL
ncbi:MAG: hypothetical protein A2725_02080 [Candidatus Magasanikbacteria bacterium RIFCSPHIGHO2_01_FULL_33_34]|uniref:Uncharacterized protein n=1 Tax=Candidatus Magasanikbacteria bacterium RIFCSPHIGHO2_01_FULL_33_34 TaxID=1798671 RepID=A0A1F6LKE8_9BACT|nr:MAG: hypothetical protein A2725_02080 [Candidatus Magasanikbacteria bacterium RIFCSPHIGHO2_01_FULL_33_34]OGH65556.1 MAG: hypothetical protein A3B83_01655 [Candidatus Magasanikbacteria bacterium RIFCSPHIGHO2_02_FULL_33_17]OGH76266.1 MAG: hypothetical protein A3A89_02475 [Candidatus Magasanikbacteria bacterium RIFCSPLOWO2_01_FULL_33_34]